MPTSPALNLALHFINRELRSRYLGSLSGGVWALAQPLIQLAVYGAVFVYVFKASGPTGPSSTETASSRPVTCRSSSTFVSYENAATIAAGTSAAVGAKRIPSAEP